VLDKVTIAYRGATYELGRGADYFGIWNVAGTRSQPQEWWPETEEGWSDAWKRFTALETPEAITPVGRTAAQSGGRAGARFAPAVGAIGAGGGLVAASLLGVGVILGVAGLFPDYLGGTSVAAQPDNLVAHVIYLATWTVSGVLIALGGTRLRIGALLATGLSIVTFGLFLADAGTPIAGGAHLAGAGLVLSLLGWLACAAGSALAFFTRTDATRTDATRTDATPTDATQTDRSAGRPFSLGRPRGAAVGPAVLLILAGLGAAAAFAPAWDSFTLRTAAGQTQTVTAGNAFSAPGAVIAGDVVVMVALAAVIIVAALWRPVRYGAALLAGAIIPVVAQAISALVQAGEATSPAQFGFTPTQASQLGLTISNGLTPAFWIYCVFVVVLVVSCVWMLFTPHEAAVLAGPGAEAGPGTDADPQMPTWHVARADAYDVTGVPSPASGQTRWDVDDEADDGTFDSYEELDSGNPVDSAVTPAAERDERDEPGRPD